MNNLFNILNDDLINKIIDIRTDEINEEIKMASRFIDDYKHSYQDLKITNKTNEEMEKFILAMEEDDEYILSYNDKYNITYKNFSYSCDTFLFDTIHCGNVVFVFYFCDIINTPNQYYSFICPKIFKNPTMFNLMNFTSFYIEKYNLNNTHNYIEGFNILNESSYEMYDIEPIKGVKYIELMSGS